MLCGTYSGSIGKTEPEILAQFVRPKEGVGGSSPSEAAIVLNLILRHVVVFRFKSETLLGKH